eukprot:6440952-Amphidinium_carterae.1
MLCPDHGGFLPPETFTTDKVAHFLGSSISAFAIRPMRKSCVNLQRDATVRPHGILRKLKTMSIGFSTANLHPLSTTNFTHNAQQREDRVLECSNFVLPIVQGRSSAMEWKHGHRKYCSQARAGLDYTWRGRSALFRSHSLWQALGVTSHVVHAAEY